MLLEKRFLPGRGAPLKSGEGLATQKITRFSAGSTAGVIQTAPPP